MCCMFKILPFDLSSSTLYDCEQKDVFLSTINDFIALIIWKVQWNTFMSGTSANMF